MTDSIQVASDVLLTPSGLAFADIDRVMGDMLGRGIDYADLYFQYTRQEGWSLEDGAVKSGSRSTDQGVGLRAVSGEKTGFAYSDEFVLPALAQAADAAKAIAHSGGMLAPATRRPRNYPSLYSAADPIASLTDKRRFACCSVLRRRLERVIHV